MTGKDSVMTGKHAQMTGFTRHLTGKIRVQSLWEVEARLQGDDDGGIEVAASS